MTRNLGGDMNTNSSLGHYKTKTTLHRLNMTMNGLSNGCPADSTTAAAAIDSSLFREKLLLNN